jgi:hypothetical protein
MEYQATCSICGASTVEFESDLGDGPLCLDCTTKRLNPGIFEFLQRSDSNSSSKEGEGVN